VILKPFTVRNRAPRRRVSASSAPLPSCARRRPVFVVGRIGDRRDVAVVQRYLLQRANRIAVLVLAPIVVERAELERAVRDDAALDRLDQVAPGLRVRRRYAKAQPVSALLSISAFGTCQTVPGLPYLCSTSGFWLLIQPNMHGSCAHI